MTLSSAVDAVEPGEAGRALVLDHRDSFVFNLVDELQTRGIEVTTIRADVELSALAGVLRDVAPHLVVLSPGPGQPEDAGIMVEWLRTDPLVPVLGVCLGHQALAVAAGGAVGPAPRAVHGRIAEVAIDASEPLFAGLGSSFTAARYHSLVVTRVPECMKVIATVADAGHDLVMALRHRERCRVGLQFHPESILTPLGRTLLWRFFDEARRRCGD